MLKYCILFLLNFNFPTINSRDYVDIKFNKILNDLDSIIKTSSKKSQFVEKRYNLIIDKIRKNEIQVVYDTTLNYGFIGGTGANIVDSLNYSLAFGQFIIDAYDSFPHLVQGMIIHEFQHLYDFLTNRELIEISKKNPIENTYFEIDALSIEALFLKTYIGLKSNLSPVEEYLIADFDNYGLGSATLFNKVDLGLLHRMDAIREKKISFEQGLKEFVDIGKELLEKTVFTDDKWNNYCNVVTLRTYTYYSKQVLHDLLFVFAKKNYTAEELKMDQFPSLNDIVNQIQKVSGNHKEYFEYYNETMTLCNEYISKRIKH